MMEYSSASISNDQGDSTEVIAKYQGEYLGHGEGLNLNPRVRKQG
ncbi:hypothetical protein [Microbulbifer sp. A4B17]|nr:hypothetical protein [Microbulbifer sp. A4B17]